MGEDRDDYAEALDQPVAAVAEGRELEASAGPREPPQDLMAALEADIEAAHRDHGSQPCPPALYAVRHGD